MNVCIRCGGSGKYMGNGMMMSDCQLCADDEIIASPMLDISKIDRKSQSYKTAIKDIMQLNPAMTRVEAVKLFDEMYAKEMP